MSLPWDQTGEIYLIQNKLDKKIYIGQVRSYRPGGGKRGTSERWYEHVRCAKKNKNACVLLERSIREDGEQNFTVMIVCYAHLNQLDDLESHYIKLYRTTEREYGYNMTTGGKNNISNITREVLSIKVKEQWKDPEFRKKVSDGVKKASIERWKNPETRERMRKNISDSVRKSTRRNDLPEYIYYRKDNNGNITGYTAAMNFYKKTRSFGSKKLTMDEKMKLALDQVESWKRELGLN